MRIAVLGAGAWGTSLAISLSANSNSAHQVTLWSRDPQHVAELVSERVNKRYFPAFPLPDSLRLTSALDVAVEAAELALIVVPVSGLRATLRGIVACGKPVPVIWGCKGFEARSAKLPHQVAEEEYDGMAPCGVLSGPSFAQEVAQGLPAALTLASHDVEFSRRVAAQLHTARLRVYSCSDIVGVETGGAVKNVISIAAGICDGLALGYNARAALITRGLAEIARLGLKLGGSYGNVYGIDRPGRFDTDLHRRSVAQPASGACACSRAPVTGNTAGIRTYCRGSSYSGGSIAAEPGIENRDADHQSGMQHTS